MPSQTHFDIKQTLFVGDVQGCYDSLRKLLQKAGFQAERDKLIVLGDLVNRGPASLEVLEYAQSLGKACRAVLGNHDLHLLALAAGARSPRKDDTLEPILKSPRRAELLGWLERQPLALKAEGLLCVHAGVLPQWTQVQTLSLARELSQVIASESSDRFFKEMYGNEPRSWRNDLSGLPRLRMITNALTRLRFCSAEGEMDFETKEGAAAAPHGFMPWFDAPRRTARSRIAFGHWSTLGLRCNAQIVSLDTGCVWGGKLSALRVAHAREGKFEEILSVKAQERV